MRKIVIIFIFGIILSGCAVTKKIGNGSSGRTITGNLIESTNFQNISNNSYFIQRADIEIITADGKEKFISTIKFEKPDKYLISVKSRTGIEGARIYITKDTILVNDRINKKLYSGTADYLRFKYGISPEMLPLIFGDIILDRKCENSVTDCTNDIARLDCAVKGVLLKYLIDCKNGKTGSVSFEDQGINIRYDKYFATDSIVMPRIIEFRSEKYGTEINIKIVKVEAPWNGNISFISGKGYELIKLR